MSTDYLTFDNFQGGERGTINDWLSIPGTFRALNMIVLRTGELCVRPGLKNISPASGLANGKIWNFAPTDGAHNHWYIQGNQLISFETGAPVAATGTLAGTPTEPVPYVNDGPFIYFTVRGIGTYKWDVVGNAITQLTNKGGRAIALYSELLMIGNTSDLNPNRIYWSDVADYATWPVDNFMDIGNNEGVGGMYLQNNHLTILKQGSIWGVYGQPGYNETVRQLLKINSGLNQYNGAAAFLDEIYFQGLGSAWPAKFNGAAAAILHNLEYTTVLNGTPSAADVGVIPIRNRDEGVMFLSSNSRAALLLNNVWTFQQFGVSLAGFGNNDGGIDNVLLLTDGGGVSAHPKFYVFEATAQHPGLESVGISRPGDDSAVPITGSVTFPMQQRRDGAEFKLRSIAVNFRKWNTGGSENNKIEVQARTVRKHSGAPVTSSAVVVLDEDPSLSDVNGTEGRVIVNFPEVPEGNAFQIIFPTLKGVAIQSYTVALDGIGTEKR